MCNVTLLRGAASCPESSTLPLIGGKTIRDLLLLEFVESSGRRGNVGVYEAAAGAQLWQGSARRRRREAALFGFRA